MIESMQDENDAVNCGLMNGQDCFADACGSMNIAATSCG
jgi:hypothetical protein